MEVEIRHAQFQDLEGIYNLVEELAIYEKARHEMWLTLEDYKNLFREKTFESIVAIADDKVVGTCIFYNTFSTWKGKMLYLEDFVVKNDVRKSGIGQKLFDRYLEIARERGCALTKWQVLDWNDPAIKFYEKYNAVIEKEWWNGKIVF